MDLKVFVYFITAFSMCVASYHEQYRVPKVCTDKWESYVLDDKEYIIQNFPVKWEYARILCRGYHNATLAVLDTAEKADFVAEALSESQFSLEAVWVGSRRASGDDPLGYRWAGGVPLRRTSADVLHENSFQEQSRHFPVWLNRTHVPVPEGGADCVAIDRVLHDKPVFLDLPCHLERGFVCEREAHVHVPVKELSLVRCKTGLYHVYNGRMTWDQAAAYCVLKKMTLANVQTMRCLKKLGMTMLKSRPSIENAWVGARGELGHWTWIDSGLGLLTPSVLVDVSPANWPPMRDRSSIKQNGCLQLDRHSSHSPVFLEARCERKMQFICYEGNSIAASVLRTATAPPSDDNYYYILVRQLLFWQHAYENCIKMNGTLAAIDNNDILIQLLLVMGENPNEPVDHVWLSGRLNITKDIATDTITYSWNNPSNGKRIPDPKSFGNSALGVYSFHGVVIPTEQILRGDIPPWLDDDFTSDNSCLNLDRQNHLSGLVYGLPCDTPQYSVCMIEKSLKPLTPRTAFTEPTSEATEST